MNLDNLLTGVWVKNKYYFSKVNHGLVILDSKFKIIEEKNSKEEIISITKDNKYFYLLEKNSNDCILVFDKELNFIKKLQLNIPYLSKKKILNINYCKNKKALLVTTDSTVYLVSLKGELICIVFEVKEEISKNNDCLGPLCCIPEKIKLLGAICCCDEIYISYKLCDNYYISKLKNGELEEPVYCSKNIILAMILVNDYIWVLTKDNCKVIFVSTGIECKCDCPPDCDGGDIISSIAKIENCIAKILCAESDKIKAAIKTSTETKDLICVNESVNHLIYQVTILEFVLTEKLRLATNPCNDCDFKCECCNPCSKPRPKLYPKTCK